MSKSKFENDLTDQIDEGRAFITLVGMSNTGKSAISSKLADELGFTRVCVDDLIEEELEPVLKKLGYTGLADMAKWMGQPHDTHSEKNQSIYLRLEEQVMEKIINDLEKRQPNKNLVIDTTGSVAHLSQTVRFKLKSVSTVVYFKLDQKHTENMFQTYLSRPKPIVWGGIYELNHEYASSQEALAVYYPKLLEYRARRYSAMSDVVIPRDLIYEVTAKEFIEILSFA